MKRLLLSVRLLSLSLLSAVAENYPYKSDVLWVTVPNHADWLYKTGEKATVEVQFYKYGIPRDNVTVTYEIGGDMMPVADTKGSITLKNGRGVIPVGTMKEPGFRDCRLKATVDGKTYSHHITTYFISDGYVISGDTVFIELYLHSCFFSCFIKPVGMIGYGDPKHIAFIRIVFSYGG